MKSKLMWLMVVVALVGLAGVAAANNVQVVNVKLRDLDTSAKTMKVSFDLSWDNSWRGVENWDAAWVFVKFLAPNSNNWEHALLSPVDVDHSVPGGTVSVATNGANGIGVFVYDDTPHTGSVSFAKAQLLWNYGSNGYSFAKGAMVDVSVQAIEMVYVPEGLFYLGSGGSENYHFYAPDGTSQTTNPFLVTAENEWITIGGDAGNLYYLRTNGYDDGTGTLGAEFPKGYHALYCMKYEITQGQYVDFLNKLTRTQQAARSGSQTADYYAMSAKTVITDRNGIRCPSSIPAAPEVIVFGCDGNANGVFNETDDAMDRACNYLSWQDVLAYADWAGFRPMSELEFEKACRGSGVPVANEYPWGSVTAPVTLDATGCVGVDGSGTETPSPTNANCLIPSGLQGPARGGIFATLSSSRAAAGASYWGIMELAGNVNERVVMVGKATARTFTGLHGDGVLTVAGEADAAALTWPTTDGANGAGGWCRGGSWAYNAACVSDRFYFATVYGGRNRTHGGRGVRTAP